MTNIDQTAILVFSRFAEEEANKKKYGHYVGKRNGIVIARKLINHTINEANRVGLPVYKYFSDKQKGNSFGERLSNSIETIFSDGFSNVIIIGTDCPSINADVIIKAHKKLQQQDIVIGPSKDGGVYLIALKNVSYERNDFLAIPWLSGDVYNGFVQYAKHLELLLSAEQPQNDLDDYGSIIEWTKSNRSNALTVLFNSILTSLLQIKRQYEGCKLISATYLSKDRFRGPPSSYTFC